MINSKNKMGDINNSKINELKQLNIEKQENHYTFNNFQIGYEGGRFIEMYKSHRLFPYYAVDFAKMNNGNYTLLSVPTCEEAKIKYPINFKSSFVVVDERYKDIKDSKLLLDMLQFADSPVEVKVNRFEQYLGEVKDPYPNPELSPFQDGVRSYIIPHKRELPYVLWNVDIKFEDSNYAFNNIKLKLTKRMSSNTFILDNYAQKTKPILIQLDLNFDDKKCDGKLNYKINENRINNSQSKLEYDKFCLNLMTKKYSIIDRKDGRTLFSGEFRNKIDNKNIESLNSYINILNKIICIEKYFNIRFNVPDYIDKNDIVVINKLYNYVKDSKKTIKALDVHFSFLKKNTNIKQIKTLVNLPRTSIMNSSSRVSFKILGITIKIEEIIERFDNVKCGNIEEVNNLIENYKNLPDNFEIKIKMISASGKYLHKITQIKF